MGEAPCEYAIVGTGSLACEEITPYSDFEHIILLCNDKNYKSYLEYFKWFSVIFHIVVLNVHETIVPSLNIDSLNGRGGVKDTRLEAKAKDTKKIRGQGQPFRGQKLSRPRTGMLEAKAKDQGHKRKDTSARTQAQGPRKKGLHKNFSGDLQKKVFTKIFQAISTKKRFPKNFSSAPQNFNNSKNSAVLEPRTGQFPRT